MDIPGYMRRDVILAPYTTLGLGGAARFFAEVTDVGQLWECLKWARAHGVPVHILGAGSNTVFADEGFVGLVVRMGTRGIDFGPAAAQVHVTAQAGETWAHLVDTCVAQGLGGVECLAGIPGQVGAAPVQNVGAYGQEVGDVLFSVRVLDRQQGELVELPAAECALSYRQSRFKGPEAGRFVILQVTLALHPEARPQVRYPELAAALGHDCRDESLPSGAAGLRRVRDAVMELRRRKSMVIDESDPQSRSAGSFFINPVLGAAALAALRARLEDPSQLPVHYTAGGAKVSAAWLIEEAGFPRGTARDGVSVSPHHALALVNRTGTSRALLALARDIREAVFRRFGIRLEMEPVAVGPRR